MTYRFLQYRRSSEGGWEPNLSIDASFALLADPGNHPAQIGLFCVDPYDLDADVTDGWPVSDELEALLYSAESYPPAMAITREVIPRLCRGRDISVEEFAAILIRPLTLALQSQPDNGFILAESLVDKLGYRMCGEFAWVLDYDPGRDLVSWVSSDYFIYTDAASGFGLEKSALNRLEGRLRMVMDAIYDAH